MSLHFRLPSESLSLLGTKKTHDTYFSAATACKRTHSADAPPTLAHAPRALSRAPPPPANWPSATPQGQETRLLAEATNLQQMGWPAQRAGSSAPPAWRRRTKTPERRETAAAPTSPHAPQLDNQGPTRKARCFANHPCFEETKIIFGVIVVVWFSDSQCTRNGSCWNRFWIYVDLSDYLPRGPERREEGARARASATLARGPRRAGAGRRGCVVG